MRQELLNPDEVTWAYYKPDWTGMFGAFVIGAAIGMFVMHVVVLANV